MEQTLYYVIMYSKNGREFRRWGTRENALKDFQYKVFKTEISGGDDNIRIYLTHRRERVIAIHSNQGSIDLLNTNIDTLF